MKYNAWCPINQFVYSHSFFCFVYSIEREKERIAHIGNGITKHVYDVRTDVDDTFYFDFMPCYRKLKETNRLMFDNAVYSIQKNKI